MNFLQSVASYYVAHKKESDWNDLCFVFTSHRAGVIFRKALQKAMGKRVIIGLQVKTINELIAEKSKLIVADNLTLTFELYKVYHDEVFADLDPQKFDKDRMLSFDYFYSWASMFLGDFDDVDKYMVDAEQLFSNVHEYEEAGDDYSHLSEQQREAIQRFWNDTFFQQKTDGSGDKYKERFVEIYKRLHSLYTKFRERLQNKGLAYQGMVVREVAEMYRDHRQPNDECHYAFVGFNALTKAEKIILERLRDARKADFFWDYTQETKNIDIYAKEHGPWRFISQLACRDFIAPNDYEVPKPNNEAKQIEITEFAYQHGQTAKVNDWLLTNKDLLMDDNSEESIAIVLTDENMLLPVLSAIPEGIKYNVTMGYPLKCSTAFSLLNLIISLQRKENVQQYNDDISFYHKPVLAILQHPIVATLVDPSHYISTIIENNIVRVRKNYFNDADTLVQQIFTSVNSDNIIEYIKNIFDTIYKRIDGKPIDDVTRECVYMIQKVINRFADLIASANIETDTSLWFTMLLQLAELQTVDFIGEPVKGLQIMGILESRSLDFNKLIMLDMNEGVFPKTSVSMSFIPYSLRRFHGLPTYEYQDSIYSYYFFRLMNRVQNAELMYVTPSEGRQGMSRFLLQIKYQNEIAPKVAIHDMPNNEVFEPIPIEKTDSVIQQLDNKFSRNNYLSPTAFTNYIKCPIYFLYNNVLGIGNDDEVVEDVGNQQIGTIFHHVMENLYQNNLRPNEIFTNEIRNHLLSDKRQIESLIVEGFGKALNNKNFSQSDITGRNIIIFNVVKKIVEKILKSEPVDFKFIRAEEKIEGGDVIYELKSKKLIRLGGIIDRQDVLPNGYYRVADYKTGKSHKASFDENLFATEKWDNNKALIQTLIYCYLLRNRATNPIKGNLYPYIIWIQDILKNKVNDKDKYELEYSNVEKEFETMFIDKIEEIFDPSISFKPTTNTKACEKCMFQNICYTKKITFMEAK